MTSRWPARVSPLEPFDLAARLARLEPPPEPSLVSEPSPRLMVTNGPNHPISQAPMRLARVWAWVLGSLRRTNVPSARKLYGRTFDKRHELPADPLSSG